MKILQIDWLDSGMHIDHGWAKTAVYLESAAKWNGKVTTTGALLYEDDHVIVLGLSRDVQNDSWYGAQLIYKNNIVYRRELS